MSKLIQDRESNMLLSYLVKSAAVVLVLMAPLNVVFASCPCDGNDSDDTSTTLQQLQTLPNSNSETQQQPIDDTQG